MAQTMQTIKSLGLVTLQLEAELEQSWDIVRKTSYDVDEIVDKQDVTKENVTAFMSSIEVKVAELLIETGNQHSFAQTAAQAPQLDFTKMPQMSEQEFTEGMRQSVDGDNNEEDVMFMSMQDFKNKLDMMSSQQQ